ITLGTHTTGNYISSTTGSNTITITGTPGEGWVPVFSVTDDSITASKLALGGANGAQYQVLMSDGDGTFSWTDAGASSGYVKQSFAGQLAFYAADGITATGTTGLFWDNGNTRLGIGTTTPGASLSIGTTINNQFLVNATGIVTDGTWQGDAINDAYISSSTYWNAAYFGRVTNVTAPLTFTGNTIGLDGLYNIPLIASTTEWNNNYNLVNSKYASWDAVAASSTFYNTNSNIVNSNYASWNAVVSSSSLYNWAYNTVNSNYAAWNAVAASSTFYNQAYNWGNHAGLYDMLGQATSTLAYHTGLYNHDSFVAVAASSTFYNTNANIVASNYLNWNSAFTYGISTAGTGGEIWMSDGNGAGVWTSTSSLLWDNDFTANGLMVRTAAGMYEATSTLAINFGGTGATTPAGAITNLGLDNIYTYGITTQGNNGEIWMSDGSGAGTWMATNTLGLLGLDATLSDLANVTAGSPTLGDILSYNGSQWVNSATGTLGLLGNSTVAGLSTDYLSKWNGTSFTNSIVSDNGSTATVAGALSAGTTTVPSLTITGGTSLPSNPTEGQMFYNTTEKKVYTYTGARWKTDGATASKIVAASDSPNKEKADYICDGTNDETEINQAIDAVYAAGGGGVVYLMEGNYEVGTSTYADYAIRMATSTTLMGAGDKTVIKLRDNFNANIDVIRGDNYQDNILITQLKVDGNKANQSSGTQYGIQFYRVGTSTIDNVEIFNSKNSNIYLNYFNYTNILNSKIIGGDYGLYLGSSITFSPINIINNRISENTYGIIGSSWVYFLNISNNIIINNVNDGINAYLANSNITNNIINNNGWDGIAFEASTNNVVNGNVISYNASNGLSCLSSCNYNTINNNQFNDNGGSTGNSSIYVSGGDNIVISNNVIMDSAGTGYAIDISSSGSNNNYISGNYYSGTGASSIRDLGTGTNFTQHNRLTVNAGASDYSAAYTALSVTQSGTGDIVNFFDGATEVFTILDGGNVGIGDDSPDNKLDIMSSGAASTFLAIANTNAGDYDAAIKFELVDNTPAWVMGVDDSDGDKFKISSSTALGTNDRFVIDVNGNIGIGTSSPLARMDIYGNLTLSGADRYINFGDGTGTSSYGFRDNGGTMQYKNSGGQWIDIGSAGSAGELGSLSNVSVGGAVTGDLLMFNGSSWVNAATATLGLLYPSNIGSTVQGYDDGLQALAVFNLNGLMLQTADNTFAATSTLAINFGGTGATTPAGAITNLGLDNIYTYGITTQGNNGELWMSDGSGAGTWMATSSLGLMSSGLLDGLSSNYLVRWDGSAFVDSGIYDTGTFVGLGTTSPAYLFDVSASSSDYLARIYNSNVSELSGGLSIRVDGTGNLLNLNYAGTDVFTVTGAQTTFNNPVSFASIGNVSLANDLVMTNASAGNILFNGPGYIRTDSSWQNLNLTISAANLGEVIIDDTLNVTSTTTLADLLYINPTLGNVGISTSSPLAKLDVYGNLMLSGTDRYISFATSSGVNGYGFRDSAGTLQYKNMNSQWTAFSTSTVSAIDDLSDVTISSVLNGNLLKYNGSVWVNVATSTLGLQTQDSTLTALAAFDENGLMIQTATDTFTATSVLAINYGGTGANTISGARTALGLAIGTDVQAYDAGLGNLASYNTDGFIYQIADNTFAGTSTIAINMGGTGATTVAGAITALGLDNIYSYGITSAGTYGDLWMSDGSGAGQWLATSSLGLTNFSTNLNDIANITAGDYGEIIMWDGINYVGMATSTLGFIADNDFTANGIMVRTAAGIYASRYATGTLNEIFVANGDGVADNITVSLPDVVYLGANGKLGRDADNLLDYSIDNQLTFRNNGADQMILNSNGYLGIGTTTPQNALTVLSADGAQLRLAYDTNNYVNFLVNNAGELSIQPSGLATSTIGSGDEALRITEDGRIGIGTTTPSYLLDIYGSSTEYLARIYNSNTSASSSGLSIRTDGTGNILNLNYAGADVFTVTAEQSIFYNPVAFVAAGDIDFANNITMSNAGGAYLDFSGAGYIRTDSGSEDLDLTFSAANNGSVIVDDTFTTTGTTTLASLIYIDPSTGTVGISSSSPSYLFAIGNNLGINSVGTLTGGTWNGNVIGVAYGGTGTTSTPTLGQILVGNDASGYNFVATGSLGLLGNNIISTLTTNYASKWNGSAFVNSLIFDNNTNIGIGTSSPLAKLDVYGNLTLSGMDRYINFGDGTGTSSYGFRDNGGTMQYKNSGGQWIDIGSAGSAGELGSLSNVSVGGAVTGDLLMYNGSSWVNAATGTLGLQVTGNYLDDSDFSANGLMVRTANGTYTSRSATGTLNQISVLNPTGEAGDIQFGLFDTIYLGANGKIGRDADNLLDFSTDNQLTFRTNGTDQMILDATGNLMLGTSTASSKLTLLSTGNQLTLAYDANNYTNFSTDSSGRLNIVSSAASAGGRSLLVLGSGSAADVGTIMNGGTNDYWMGIDDTDGSFHIGTSTTIGSSTLFTILNNGNVGIGTTSPDANFTVVGNGTNLSENPVFSLLNGSSTNLLTVLENGSLGIGSSSPTGLLTIDNRELMSVQDYFTIIEQGGLNVFSVGRYGVVKIGNYPLSGNFAADLSVFARGGSTPIVDVQTEAQKNAFFINGDGWVSIGTSSNQDLLSSDRYELTVQSLIGGLDPQIFRALNSSGQYAMVINNDGNIGIGTTTPTDMFVVGATSTSQFLVNQNGQITDGSWLGDVIGLAYGGTNKNMTAVAGGIVYTDSDSMEVTSAGTGGYILMSNGSAAPAWVSSSTFIWDNDFTSNGMMARTAAGGYASRTITGTANEITLANGDGASANPTISLPDAVYLGTAGVLGRDADNNINFATDNYLYFKTDTNTRLTIDPLGNIGIGTTTPDSALTIGADPLNQFKVNDAGGVTAGTWMGEIINPAYGGTGTSTWQTGGLVFSDGSQLTQSADQLFWDSANNRLGLGTNNPLYTLDVQGNLDGFLSSIYNAATSSNAGGLYLRSDGLGNILTVNYNGDDVFTVSGAESTFYNPVNFAGDGDISIGRDINLINESMGYINFSGAGYIRTNDASADLDLTLLAANGGKVIIDDMLNVTGTTTIADLLFIDPSTGRIGIGTSSPMGTTTLTIDGSLYATDIYTSGNTFYMNDQAILSNGGGTLRLYNAAGYYSGLQASSTATSNFTWTLPVTDGTDGQVLKTDGSGAMSWTDLSITDTLTHTFTSEEIWTPVSDLIAMGSYTVTIGPDSLVNGILDLKVDGQTEYSFDENSPTTTVNVWPSSSVSVEATGIGFNMSLASYDTSKLLSTQDAIPADVIFNTDGTKMFIDGQQNNKVYEYVCSTAFDIDTCSYDSSLDISTNSTNPYGMTFNPDGTKLFVLGDYQDRIAEYHCSVGFDISTCVHDSNLSIAAYLNYQRGLAFNNSGTKMYFTAWANSYTSSNIYEFNCSSAYDISTCAYDSATSFHGDDIAPADVEFNHDGSQMFVLGLSGADINIYDCSTNYDVSTCSYDSTYSTLSQDTSVAGLVFNNYGTKMYMVGNTNTKVYQYNISSDYSGTTTVTVIENINLWAGNSAGLSYGGGNVGIGTTGPSDLFTIMGTASSTERLVGFYNGDGTNLFSVLENGKVGIGTTTPSAVLDIYSANAASTDVMLSIGTSTGVGFKILGSGEAISDQAFNSAGADYAEYFHTSSKDLIPGEAVCIDVAENNTVKRCDRDADGNIMGIVSSNPSIVGNYKDEYKNNKDYVIVAMLGQIPARVSEENDEIRPGDLLTAGIEPGFLRKAEAGEATVGVALEELISGVATGEIKILISRRNKSLTVEAVEAQITERIANMEIEDEVAIMLADAIRDYDIAGTVAPIVDAQIAMFDAVLDVQFDDFENRLTTLASSLNSVIARVSALENGLGEIDHRISLLEGLDSQNLESSSSPAWLMTVDGNVVYTNDNELKTNITNHELGTTTTQDVAIVEIVTASTTEISAFVVNQKGAGDVADFQTDGVSIVNIADTGKVTIVGEMMVDGRIMVCSGGACGNALDSAVDETLGDMGVEGTLVAGAFAGYCAEGYVWIPGSAKYGTMPGFCLASDEAQSSLSPVLGEGRGEGIINITQGEAMLVCEAVGDGYHLISENEWLTVAENIIRNNDNDCDKENIGLQLAMATTTDTVNSSCIATSSIVFILSNGNTLYNLVGGAGEWTDKTVTRAGLIQPVSENWQEYNSLSNYNGLNIAPPYYYTSENGIGRVMTGDNELNLRGFVRGATALFDLDLSNSPTTATSSIGFRCAK
ncbi:MAG: hypothetical protein US83_C0009G0042, partial [Candidatus Falkowbacteria bacterium GW2011_GWC2_38_22]